MRSRVIFGWVQATFRGVLPPGLGAFVARRWSGTAYSLRALSVHCRARARWSAAEVALVEAVAERAWAWVERARAEAALRRGEQRLADAQARAGIGTWWWEIATGRTQFNATYYQLYGIAPGPHGFEDFLALVHADDREGVRANVERALAGAGFYEVEYRLRRVDDGVERWFLSRAQAVYDSERRPAIVGEVVQDITDRKRAELALRESEERYRVLHESQRDGFVKVTMDGALVEFNAVFQGMLGHEPEELRSLTYQELTPERWRAFEADIIRTQVLERGFSDLYEKEYRRKDGVIFPVELRAVLLRDAAGCPCGLWATVRDISARKQAETALALAKAEAEAADVAKSRFLAAASHDLRQPVQSLVLLLPLVERHINATPKATQVLNLMNKALGGLNVLLTAVLDVSRLDAGGIEPVLETVPLSGLCQRLADEYAPKAAALGLDLRVRTLDVCARTDPVLLERVLRNLVENALRYTQAGGVLLAMRRRGRTARIDVIDTGVGIAQEKQSEIFQEFTQLDNPGRDLAKGLGLGLAIVSRLSALLRLNVAVTSKPSRGSRFSVSLDVAEPAAPKAAPESASARQGGSVLVIEDNQILRLAIEAILSESGYDTLAAASGEEAVALVNARRPLDAIVTDYRLGAGLNGVEAAREIERRLGRTLPKLLLTGEAGNRQFEEVDLTSFEFLYKPISADKLQAKLAAMMRGGAFASEVEALIQSRPNSTATALPCASRSWATLAMLACGPDNAKPAPFSRATRISTGWPVSGATEASGACVIAFIASSGGGPPALPPSCANEAASATANSAMTARPFTLDARWRLNAPQLTAACSATPATKMKPSHSWASLFRPVSEWKNISTPVTAMRPKAPMVRGVTHSREIFMEMNSG